MTVPRVPATMGVLLLALAVSGTAIAAQATPQDPAAQTPAVEAPDRPSVQPTPPVETTQPVEPRFPRPIFRALQDYRLGKGDVAREIRALVGDVTVEGTVRGDVLVIVGELHLASTAVVEGTAVVIAGTVTVDAGARIDRDFVVVGGSVDAPSDFSPGHEHVVIGTPYFGDALRDVLPWVTQGLLWGRLIVPDLEWVWVVVLIFFLAYLTLNTVMDRGVAATADVISDRPVTAFLVGLLVLVLSVPVLAIVAASVIGLVIVPFLFCGMVVAAMVGKTAVARSIGRGIIRPTLPEGRGSAFTAFLIGFVVLTFTYVIPVLGFVTWALTGVLGLGAATATLRTHMRRERKITAPPIPSPAPAPEGRAASVPPVAPLVPASPLSEHPPAAVPLNATDGLIDAPPPSASEPSAAPPPPPAGSPRPTYGEGLAQYPRAMFMDRLAAFVLDCILVAIINALLDRHNDDGFYFFLLIAYHVGFWAWKGTTLGGIVLNLRVIRTDGGDPRPADAVIRVLSGILSIVALGIGYLWMLQDPEHQTWHDKIAGTLVVKVPRELVMRA